MTRKHFRLLAELFADLIDCGVIDIDKTNELSKVVDYNLRKSNPDFSIDKFNNAITKRLTEIQKQFEPSEQDTHEDLYGY